ncbi:hypothetical protein FE374_01360 [Georgenia yuyongxinii]|uniref:Uncharacterized protein n=1 Tax=Georgenia yuyongxinii TaxID=2589797 RepID=A0A5B8C048_9MICO|nr:hypothetical protein [Georgenia yuyongxinii]QDC23457.1 hypothetical protein FE374_01360 [Georgenia yuyongxinii]
MDDPGAEHEQQLAVELAEAVLAQTAPEELDLLEETSAEYFADPDGVLRPRRTDESVGFGVDLALLTPYVLAVLAPVVQFLLGVARDALKDELKPAIAAWVRGVIRHVVPGAGTPAGPGAGTPAGPSAGTPAGPGTGTPAGPGTGTPAGGGKTPALTPDQAHTVRDIAFRRARDLGIEEPRAALLADAVAGGVLVSG